MNYEVECLCVYIVILIVSIGALVFNKKNPDLLDFKLYFIWVLINNIVALYLFQPWRVFC